MGRTRIHPTHPRTCEPREPNCINMAVPNRKLYQNKQPPKQSCQTPGINTQGQNNNQTLATKK